MGSFIIDDWTNGREDRDAFLFSRFFFSLLLAAFYKCDLAFNSRAESFNKNKIRRYHHLVELGTNLELHTTEILVLACNLQATHFFALYLDLTHERCGLARSPTLASAMSESTTSPVAVTVPAALSSFARRRRAAAALTRRSFAEDDTDALAAAAAATLAASASAP